MVRRERSSVPAFAGNDRCGPAGTGDGRHREVHVLRDGEGGVEGQGERGGDVCGDWGRWNGEEESIGEIGFCNFLDNFRI